MPFNHTFLAATAFAILSLQAMDRQALAGDFATRSIIGFTADASRFAFEEYGRQDGSGFPYSNIYVIETATDNWVAGTPVRVRIDDESASVADARRQAEEQAGALLGEIVEPGLVAATNQATEINDNPYRMVARERIWTPPTDQMIEFRIDLLPMAGPEYCGDFGETVGFRLLEVATRPGLSTRILHEDASLPSSRGCPLDYRFHDIVTYHPMDGGQPVVAIIILVERVGFEGPDGRYLAVTAPLQ